MAKETLNIRAAADLGRSVRTLADVPELLGAVYDLDGLILTEADLGPDFFELRSGLAGELFQKLVNYRVRTALVLPDFTAHGERFAELAHEHAAHPWIRFVRTEEEARAWLTASARL
ncbi:DUF4180 domain-containing protein [Deinococcus budaensis]|uniref:DUF4180 domain-containing protein n=1 Tax=Deinococcus budaensis TaxID=1665626 RepID=A0A7W8GCE2_9DEIO|nr:DUF4180 domain-containing protein [Deinococcus budaensis]MBB5232997.1 hypothetical protein [Deinococcus budaensis]